MKTLYTLCTSTIYYSGTSEWMNEVFWLFYKLKTAVVQTIQVHMVVKEIYTMDRKYTELKLRFTKVRQSLDIAVTICKS